MPILNGLGRATFGRSEGFSLRDSLIRQGVTTEEGLRKHLSFISRTISINPNLDITRYRVSSNNPNNGVPDNG